MGLALEERLIGIYDSFDVFAFPSLYEGFGLPILEAQSRGLPVIIYKYGKIPSASKTLSLTIAFFIFVHYHNFGAFLQQGIYYTAAKKP